MKSITLKQLVFTGNKVETEKLVFADNLNLIYGASNTGKSFTLEVLDFMLGGDKIKRKIYELSSYNKIWLSLAIEENEIITLSRSTEGNIFEVYNGIVTQEDKSLIINKLCIGATQKNRQSISEYFLEYLNLNGKKVAVNQSGEKQNLSFRDLIKFCLVDEKSIMRDKSPIETGELLTKAKERRVFRLLLTGIDDHKLVEIMNPTKFAASKAAKIEVFKEMLLVVQGELSNKYPNEEDLVKKSDELTSLLQQVQAEFNKTQNSISVLLEQKSKLLTEIDTKNQRIREIKIHLNRFTKLDEIYQSDVERLEYLEEAGFFLSLEEKACGLCGAPTDFQSIKEVDPDKIRIAALAEINKIQIQRKELSKTIEDLKTELYEQETYLPVWQRKLSNTESEISKFSPKITETKNSINSVIADRDKVMHGLALISKRNEYSIKLDEYNKLTRTMGFKR